MSDIGIRDFRGGETLKERVDATAPGPKMRYVAGYSGVTGPLLPDLLPQRLTTAALSGTMAAQGIFAFKGASGSRVFVRDTDEKLRMVETWNGDDLNVWGSAEDTMDILADSQPLRLGPLIAVPTGGANAAIRVYEPDAGTIKTLNGTPTAGGSGYSASDLLMISEGMGGTAVVASVSGGVVTAVTLRAGGGGYTTGTGKATTVTPLGGSGCTLNITALESNSRDLSLKGPLSYYDTVTDYDGKERPAVVVSARGTTATQLFDLVNGGAGWAVAAGAPTGVDANTIYNDYQMLTFDEDCVPSQDCFTHGLGGTVAFTNKEYLVMDMALTYDGEDPAESIVSSGDFVNTDQSQYESGFVLAFYDAVGWVRTFKIPLLKTGGAINRVVFHLGDLNGQTITEIRIGTASTFVAPGAGKGYFLWVYADATLEDDWKQSANFLMDAVIFRGSPWVQELPPDPGTLGTSAVVLERFPGSFDESTPDRPLVRYAYVYRGRSAVGDPKYKTLISNPSLQSSPDLMADPWRSYQVTVTLPDNGGTVEDLYNDCATHVLLYRQTYTGIETNIELGEMGVWSAWEFVGFRALDPGWTLVYTDAAAAKEAACTPNTTTNAIAATAHGLMRGNWVKFHTTTTDVTAGLAYYVFSRVDADNFKISAEWEGGTDGVEMDLTVATANTFTALSPLYAIDGEPIPQYMEANRDPADSARYLATADGRVYTFHRKWNNTTEEWELPLDGQVSNWGDFSGFPTSASRSDDGKLLQDLAPNGVEAKGVVVKDTVKVLFFDSEFGELLGDESSGGWYFHRRGGKGLQDQRTLVDFPGQIIWQPPSPDYFHRFAGGIAEPISKGLLEPSWFDWDVAHGFVQFKDQYVGFCNYADPAAPSNWCLLIYDLKTQSWWRHHSTAFQLASICTDGSNVYGLTSDGWLIDVFGGTGNDGGAAALYTVQTRHIRVAPPNEMRHISHGIIEAITDQSSITLTVSYDVQGLSDDSQSITGNLTVTSGQTTYKDPALNLNLTGSAVAITITYTGAYPPDIHFIGVNVADGVAG